MIAKLHMQKTYWFLCQLYLNKTEIEKKKKEILLVRCTSKMFKTPCLSTKLYT